MAGACYWVRADAGASARHYESGPAGLRSGPLFILSTKLNDVIAPQTFHGFSPSILIHI